MSLNERIARLRNSTGQIIKSPSGKDFLLYLGFVAVAFVFWLMMSLDNEVTRDYTLPLTLTAVPDSVTVVTPPPATLNVTVKAKGAQLLRFAWRSEMPQLRIPLEATPGRPHTMLLGAAQLDGMVRDYFGQGVSTVSVKPDSVKVLFTDAPGVRLPIHINAAVTTDLRSVLSGPLRTSTDTVTLYSTGPLPQGLTQVETLPVTLSDLHDTTRVEVPLRQIPGVRLIPDRIVLTAPVEPLILKRKAVRIEPVNAPYGVTLVLFPPTVDVSYLVPMSRYADQQPVRVYANYNDLTPGAQRIPLTVSAPDEGLYNLSLMTDSVEYLIDRPR